VEVEGDEFTPMTGVARQWRATVRKVPSPPTVMMRAAPARASALGVATHDTHGIAP